MRLFNLRNIVISSIMGSFMLIAGITASAQDQSEEYREWQRAQQIAQWEHNQYLRTRSQRDYQHWQQALRVAQREQMEYQQASRGYNNGNNRGNRGNQGRNRRIYRDGQYYQVDNRQAELLRQAVNRGYQQGYREGQMDRRNGRGFDHNDSDYYRRANFGYQSYVAQNQYQYYFRQGFERGYQDGYYSRTQYGNRTNILGSVLNTILRITDDN